MSDLARHHRQIAAVLEPLERMGVDATVEERSTDDDDLSVTLKLGFPSGVDSDDVGSGGAKPADLEARVAELEDQKRSTETGPDSKRSGVPEDDLTDGERETLHALQELGGSRSSGDIADEVDATLQSVRSWLPKLAQAGHIRTVPDPTDGRRKLYSPVECEEPVEETDGTSEESENVDETVENGDGAADDPELPSDTVVHEDEPVDRPDDGDRTVYIASNGGSPSQVFHVRESCPQLRNCADFVEKERSVVPNHRPCGTCVSAELDDGLVAIASESPTKTYHKQADCAKLEPTAEVEVTERSTVPEYDHCADCVHPDTEESVPTDDGATAAQICARNDVDPEDVIEALDTATTVYHVKRDLVLSREETETLLRRLGVFEALDGGGHVPLDRARSVVREHVSSEP